MTIQSTLQAHFGNRYKMFKGDIGLELETETREDYIIPKFSLWDVKNDNSLRDIGREYVLKQPLDFEINFPKALDEFSTKTKDIPFIQDSITTSCHVHLNFLNDTFLTLGNFLTLYCLTENLLIRASGEDRLSNLYCLPICDAEDIHQNILRMFRGIRDKRWGHLQFDPESTKYGALNLSALYHFGSLEIRSLRGTTDINLIKNWVGTLHALQTYARQPGLVPPQIIINYKDRKTEYLTDIFGKYRDFIRHVDEENLIEKNFWFAASLAYEIKGWDNLEHIPKPKKVKPKDLDNIAGQMFGRAFGELSTDDQRLVITVSEDMVNTTSETERPRINPYTGTEEVMSDERYRELDRIARREGVGIYRPFEARFGHPGEQAGQGALNTVPGRNILQRLVNPPPVRVPVDPIDEEIEEAIEEIPEWEEDDEDERDTDQF